VLPTRTTWSNVLSPEHAYVHYGYSSLEQGAQCNGATLWAIRSSKPLRGCCYYKPWASRWHLSPCCFPHNTNLEEKIWWEKKAYRLFIIEHFVDDPNVPVTLEEHIAFLVYWLCYPCFLPLTNPNLFSFFKFSLPSYTGSSPICLAKHFIISVYTTFLEVVDLLTI